MKQVFPVAEEIKSKLTTKYKELEKKRQEEEVNESPYTVQLCYNITHNHADCCRVGEKHFSRQGKVREFDKLGNLEESKRSGKSPGI